MRKPRGYWNNYDTCYEVAKECSYRAELKYKYPQAYWTSLKQGWINDYTWFISKGEAVTKSNTVYTKELCYEEAKKYRYSTEFRKNCGGAWNKAYQEGWLKDYTWFEDGKKIHANEVRKWNKETCYELAKQCVSRSDFKKHNAQAYKVSRENGWLDDYTWFRSGFEIYYETGIKWTYENTKEESKKYTSRQEFYDNCVGGYTRALKQGWLDEFFPKNK